jgi:hypothetical protein
MYRRVAFLSGLALCGVLAGCSSNPSISKPASSLDVAQPITVHAGTQGSWTTPIEAVVQIAWTGTYRYDLAFARVPPKPGAQPQVCIPLTGFRLVSKQGTVRYVQPAFTSTGEVSGSVDLSAGTWTGSSGRASSPVANSISPPAPPVGTFWALGCPWSLTLTPSG